MKIACINRRFFNLSRTYAPPLFGLAKPDPKSGSGQFLRYFAVVFIAVGQLRLQTSCIIRLGLKVRAKPELRPSKLLSQNASNLAQCVSPVLCLFRNDAV